MTPDEAAAKIQAMERGRQGRGLASLSLLGLLVENHYTSVEEAQEQLFDAELHSAPLIYGAALRLEGQLLKQSGLGWEWQERAAHVDNFKFQYDSRHGDAKYIGPQNNVHARTRRKKSVA